LEPESQLWNRSSRPTAVESLKFSLVRSKTLHSLETIKGFYNFYCLIFESFLLVKLIQTFQLKFLNSYSLFHIRKYMHIATFTSIKKTTTQKCIYVFIQRIKIKKPLNFSTHWHLYFCCTFITMAVSIYC